MTKSRISIILWGMIYAIAVNIGYIFFVVPNFSYLMYNYIKPHSIHILISFVFIFLILIIAPKKISIPSDLIFWIFYILLYVPIYFVPLYTREFIQENYINILGIYGILFVFMYILSSFRRLRYRLNLGWNISKNQYILGCICIYFLIMIILINEFGISLSLPSISDVYETRFYFRENSSGLASILIHNFTKAINPILIVIGAKDKNFKLIGLGIVGQVYAYSISGNKSVLFSTVLILGVYVVLKIKNNNGKAFIKYVVIFISLIYVIDIYFNNTTFTSLFLRRFIITPGLMFGMYFEYFSLNPSANLAYSFLKGMTIDNYQGMSPPFIISNYYFNRSMTSANASIFADAYANFNYFGLILFSILLLLIIYIINNIAITKNDNIFICCSLVLIIWAFTESALQVIIFRHGLFLILILYLLYPVNRKRCENE